MGEASYTIDNEQQKHVANMGHNFILLTQNASSHRVLSCPVTLKTSNIGLTFSMMPKPRGPAADPRYLLSTDPSNPYNFTPSLLEAGKLPPKITSTHVFFFGHEGSWPECCFSQWFAAPFTAPWVSSTGEAREIEFPTAEHYMMWQKSILMGDEVVAKEILADAHPSSSKRLGREVKNFDREIWAKHADKIVEEANLQKFRQNADLKDVLLATGQKVLVEASPDDRIWGIGFNANDAEGRESAWGDNRVGKALMKVRERLEAEQ